MKEQSHKSEMRAALRGDFERLRARRQGAPETVSEVPAPRAEPPPASIPAPAPGRVSWLDRIRRPR